MGLAERRASNEFQDTQFSALKAAMDAAAAFAVTPSVNWDQLSQQGASHGSAESWPNIYFQSVTDAFASVARDAIGKAALNAGRKSVMLQNSDEFNSAAAISGKHGALPVGRAPYTDVDNVQARIACTIAAHEKAL